MLTGCSAYESPIGALDHLSKHRRGPGLVPKYDGRCPARCYGACMTMTRMLRPLCLATLALSLAACAGSATRGDPASIRGDAATMFTAQRTSLHRDGDDLLTAGLGLSGLQAMTPPAVADPERPSAAEARRRALWANWRGIADLTPAGGYGTLYGSVAPVPGREFHALATVPGAAQPHRVLVQVPDDFDRKRRCIVVTASSGSRGIYGAIAVAGAWGLPKGCAVAYTDKGAGTDYFDADAGIGVAADGTPAGDRLHPVEITYPCIEGIKIAVFARLKNAMEELRLCRRWERRILLCIKRHSPGGSAMIRNSQVTKTSIQVVLLHAVLGQIAVET